MQQQLSANDVEPTPGYGRISFSCRLPEYLKWRLETAARRHGVSMNAEIHNRLEESFREEALAGGAAMRDLTRLWVAAFVRGGYLGARALGHPEWSVDQWITDNIAYKTALHTGHDALVAAQPVVHEDGADPDARANFEKMSDYFTRLVARGYAGYFETEAEPQGDKK